MRDPVGSRFRLIEAVRSRKLGEILGISMYFQAVRLMRKDLFHRQMLKHRRTRVERLRQGSLLHGLIFFYALHNPGYDAIVSVREG